MNDKQRLISGRACASATQAYAQRFAHCTGKRHFSDFLKSRIKLSSIGIGTFPGDLSEQVNQSMSRVILHALNAGINVIDTAAHYRNGQSMQAIAGTLRRAISMGYSRNEIFLVCKAGFLNPGEINQARFDDWFDATYEKTGLGRRSDLANNNHLISPAFFDQQVDLCRETLGVETIDCFLVDQPEVHIPLIGKEQLNQKLLPVFEVLEQKVRDKRIAYYGISSFSGFRVETDHVLFQSLTSMSGLAEKAAKIVGGAHAESHFRLVQMPFNQIMPEGFTRFNQATGHGNIASTLQAAYQMGIFVMTSHALAKGHLAHQGAELLTQLAPELANYAQRAIQFNRSTPGIGTTLVGISDEAHLLDFLQVVRTDPMNQRDYLKLYQRAD